MRKLFWSTVAVSLALTGCKGEAPAPETTATPTAAASAAADVSGPAIRMLAFGDSLFAGYGLASPDQSYPAQLERALRREGINAAIVNAGVSGDTTAAGRQRLAFTLDAQPAKPDLVLLELGGNDLLRGLSPDQTRGNLDAMLAELARRGIPVALFSLQAPPNYGQKWQSQFDAIFPDLAKKHGATLVPFVTPRVFTDPGMMQADRVHPSDKGVSALVGATVDQVAGALPD